MKKMILGCGHCGQSMELAVRTFSGGMAKTLVALCRIYQATGQWVNAKDSSLSKTDLEKLLLWGFTQQAEPTGRQKKSGIWAPTTEGWQFACGQTEAYIAVFVDNGGTARGFDNKQVNIQTILRDLDLGALWQGQEVKVPKDNQPQAQQG